MHPYATDSEERWTIPFFLAILAVIIPMFGYRELALHHLAVPWWLDAPSVMGFYGILRGVFERWAWRLPVLHTIGVVKVPVLVGKWDGHVCSSFDPTKRTPVSITLHQSWSKVAILLQGQQSRSRSLAASLLTDNPGGPLLLYEYDNRPSTTALETMHAHLGTARLTLSTDRQKKMLSGDYYSGRDRTNYGSIVLTRVEF